MQIKKYLTFFILLFIANFPILSVFAMPKMVIVIRHAEKTTDDDNIHLSEKGYARAKLLPLFFQKFEKLSYIQLFAQGQKSMKSSLRPIETLIPTSEASQQKINHQFVKNESTELIKFLKNTKRLSDQTVVISWGHDEIGKISELLGKNSGEWNSKVFDRALIFQYNKNGKLIHFSIESQKLLPGDSLH